MHLRHILRSDTATLKSFISIILLIRMSCMYKTYGQTDRVIPLYSQNKNVFIGGIIRNAQ